MWSRRRSNKCFFPSLFNCWIFVPFSAWRVHSGLLDKYGNGITSSSKMTSRSPTSVVLMLLTNSKLRCSGSPCPFHYASLQRSNDAFLDDKISSLYTVVPWTHRYICLIHHECLGLFPASLNGLHWFCTKTRSSHDSLHKI